MKTYKYQMHSHTVPCSHANMTSREFVTALYDGGYAGAVITNHFYNGDTGLDRAMSWEEFVKEYERDYLECKEAAKEYDLDMIFGLEEHVGGGLEVLIYGVTPEVIYAHPELIERNFKRWHDVITSHGGVVIQAHPFRERTYIAEPKVLPLDCIDGIEVYNAGNKPPMNERAEAFAGEHPELILTSGADTHSTNTACCAGIECTERIRSEAELVRVLKSQSYKIIK